MKLQIKLAIAAGALAVAITGANAADDPIQARQELMKSVGKSTKAMAQMVKGEAPFDAGEAKKAADTIAAVPAKYVTLFPEGSGKGDTEAGPKIWTDMEGFKAEAMKLESRAKAASAAAAEGEDAFKAAFAEMTQSCKSCHEGFRVKK